MLVIFLIRCLVASTRTALTTLTQYTKLKTQNVITTTEYRPPILTTLTDNNVRTLVTSTQLTTISTTPHSTPDDNKRHSLATDTTTTEQTYLVTTQSSVTYHESSTQTPLSKGTLFYFLWHYNSECFVIMIFLKRKQLLKTKFLSRWFSLHD